jgi:hypothetical protein
MAASINGKTKTLIKKTCCAVKEMLIKYEPISMKLLNMAGTIAETAIKTI